MLGSTLLPWDTNHLTLKLARDLLLQPDFTHCSSPIRSLSLLNVHEPTTLSHVILHPYNLRSTPPSVVVITVSMILILWSLLWNLLQSLWPQVIDANLVAPDQCSKLLQHHLNSLSCSFLDVSYYPFLISSNIQDNKHATLVMLSQHHHELYKSMHVLVSPYTFKHTLTMQYKT